MCLSVFVSRDRAVLQPSKDAGETDKKYAGSSAFRYNTDEMRKVGRYGC
jgi:hypothetical protein